MYTGPNLVRTNLLFGYDTGYGVADNNTSTIFYQGEPTVNYVTDTPSNQGGWTGSFSLLDSSTKSFQFNVSNFASSPGAGWRTFSWDMTSHAGSAVTISATIEVPDDSPGDLAWVMIGQLNTYTNNQGGGGYMGYSPASDRYQKSTKNTERISWSGTIGSGGSANQPNGHIGFTVWYNQGIPGTNSYIKVKDVQIEKISHATPFVNGTRSSTQGLIDLKKSINIDLANASFDSTGQPTFDGTDDKFEIKSGNLSGYATLTFETVARFNGSLDSNDRKIFHWDKTSTTNGVAQIRKGTNNGRLMYQHHNSQWYTLSVDNVVTADDFMHIVVVHDGTTATMYKNGVSIGNTTVGLLDYTNSGEVLIANRDGNEFWKGNIPVFKVYDKALTAAEIASNFNAYKNRFNI